MDNQDTKETIKYVYNSEDVTYMTENELFKVMLPLAFYALSSRKSNFKVTMEIDGKKYIISD